MGYLVAPPPSASLSDPPGDSVRLADQQAIAAAEAVARRLARELRNVHTCASVFPPLLVFPRYGIQTLADWQRLPLSPPPSNHLLHSAISPSCILPASTLHLLLFPLLFPPPFQFCSSPPPPCRDTAANVVLNRAAFQLSELVDQTALTTCFQRDTEQHIGSPALTESLDIGG